MGLDRNGCRWMRYKMMMRDGVSGRRSTVEVLGKEATVGMLGRGGREENCDQDEE